LRHGRYSPVSKAAGREKSFASRLIVSLESDGMRMNRAIALEILD
jgi:hypothetical protein